MYLFLCILSQKISVKISSEKTWKNPHRHMALWMLVLWQNLHSQGQNDCTQKITHWGRPYVCGTCGRRFCESGNLKKHQNWWLRTSEQEERSSGGKAGACGGGIIINIQQYHSPGRQSWRSLGQPCCYRASPVTLTLSIWWWMRTGSWSRPGFSRRWSRWEDSDSFYALKWFLISF